MSRRLVLSGIVLLMVGSPALAQVPFHSGLVPSRTPLARLGLERHLMVAVPIVGSERLLGISIAENLLFAQTNHGNFYTYEAETGRLLWYASLGAGSAVALPASVNSQLVFVTNFDRLLALHRGTGRPVWSKEILRHPLELTAADEERVMVGVSSGWLEAYYSRDKKATATGRGVAVPYDAKIPEHRMGQVAWNWPTNAPITSRPIVAGKVVVFASQDGKVYVVLSDVQKMVYRFVTGGPISGSMGTHGIRTLLIPSEDKNLYAIDLYTGEAKWTYPSASPIRQEPLVADDDAYVVNDAGNLGAFDAETGTLHWARPIYQAQFLAASAKRLYLRTRFGDLLFVDRASGQILADARSALQRAGLNLRDYTLALTNHLNDRLYFATPAGLVIGLRELGQVQPRPIRDPKLPPFGFIPEEGYPDALRKLGFPEGVVNPAAAAAAAAKEAPPTERPEKPEILAARLHDSRFQKKARSEMSSGLWSLVLESGIWNLES